MDVDPSVLLFFPAFRRWMALRAPLLLRELVARSPRYYRANIVALGLLQIEAYRLLFTPARAVMAGEHHPIVSDPWPC